MKPFQTYLLIWRLEFDALGIICAVLKIENLSSLVLCFFILFLGAMSDETISDPASELNQKQPPQITATSASSSSFSVTDILSPLEVVANSAHNNSDQAHFSAAGGNSNPRPRSDLIETASYSMGPTSPSAATATSDASAHGTKI